MPRVAGATAKDEAVCYSFRREAIAGAQRASAPASDDEEESLRALSSLSDSARSGPASALC